MKIKKSVKSFADVSVIKLEKTVAYTSSQQKVQICNWFSIYCSFTITVAN